ncbi:CPBP family intramembrane metalloprotease [candidate division WOR-3 bacterium]|nr:CPBP family intramembrane metalloprotease [candidate division WOR-3 bacterium]
MKKRFYKLLKISFLVFSAVFSMWFFVRTMPLFFPMADFRIPSPETENIARSFMLSTGCDLSSYECGALLKCDENALFYAENNLGSDGAQELIRDGFKIYYYDLYFKKNGQSEFFVVSCHPDSGVIGWKRFIHDDFPGDTIGEQKALEIARDFFPDNKWNLIGISRTVRVNRSDYDALFDRKDPSTGDLREIAFFSIAGKDPSGFGKNIFVPSSFTDSLRTEQGRKEALTVAGYLFMSAGGIFAFVYLIRKISKTPDFVALYSRAIILVSLCWFGTILLETPLMFASWNPLWPKALFYMRWVIFKVIGEIQILALFVSLLFAGYAFAMSEKNNREKSFQNLFGKKIFSRETSKSIVTGVLVGMIGGGIFAGLCLLFRKLYPYSFFIQPRGFYLYILNSRIPAVSSALYFLLIAVIEEVGYRHFGTMLTKKIFRNIPAAVIAVSIVYGLTHSALDFLPPFDPFWGRAILMTCIGIFWSFVYLKTDLLTVITAHYLSDLFIFNLPFLEKSSPPSLILSFFCIFWILLIPAVSFLFRRFPLGHHLK